MAGIPTIQGNISYDFREAIDALARSTADASMLASRWYDICNTEEPKEVTVDLSSGESMTVPNLAMAIESLKRREGDISASSVAVHGRNAGVDIVPSGTDVGAANAKFSDGTSRYQHHYATPYNEFYDASYVLNGSTCIDYIDFLAIPRYILFDKDSTLNAGAHALVIRPLPASAALVRNRTDKKGVCLCTEFTLVNTDLTRTAIFIIYNDAAGSSVAATVTLAPSQHARFLVWGWRGASTVNVKQL